MADPMPLSLPDVCGGGLVAQVEEELAKVAANILDPNTKYTVKRTLTIRLIFTPLDDERRAVGVTVDVASKLAPMGALQTLAYTQTRPGTRGFVEQAPPEQLVLDQIGGGPKAVASGGK